MFWLIVWAATSIGFLAGCVWVGYRHDPNPCQCLACSGYQVLWTDLELNQPAKEAAEWL